MTHSSYKTIPLSVVGGTDQVYSNQQDHELTQNYYIYLSEAGPSLQGFPGTTEMSNFVSSAVPRGTHIFNDELYQVSGTTLEKIAIDGVRTNLGTIAGTTHCIFADDGRDMFIVAAGTVYRFDTSLVTLTDKDFESPDSVAYLNSAFIYDGSGDRWVVSDIGDGSSVTQLNYANAESDPDDLQRVYTFGQRLYLFGKNTIEPWYNTGTGSPPYDRIDTGIIQKGLGAIYSVSQTDRFMYFLGDDLNFYQMTGVQIKNISNPGLAKEINDFSVTDDAVGFCFNLEGQDFYMISFPTGNKSYLYSEIVDKWVTLNFSTQGDRHLANSYQFVYGKHLISDRRSGKILEWDLDVNDDNGTTIQRRRVLPPINGSTLGSPGKRILMSRFELLMQKGIGLATGQGSDPIIMIEISTDGGQSFSTIQNLRFGEAGDFLIKVEAYLMASFYDATIRITQSDPVLSSIRGGAIDLKLAGY